MRFTLRSLLAFPDQRNASVCRHPRTPYDWAVLTCQLEHFCGEVFQDRARVHRSLSTNSHVVLCAVLEQSVHSTDGELPSSQSASLFFPRPSLLLAHLQASSRALRHGLSLAVLVGSAALATLCLGVDHVCCARWVRGEGEEVALWTLGVVVRQGACVDVERSARRGS